MVRSFNNEFNSLLRRLERRRPQGLARLHGTIMTGTLFAPVLKKMIDRLNERMGTRLHVAEVENRYFGGDVSVAGLLTGGCYLAARDSIRGDFVIIPGASIKSDEAIMLDGMNLDELERELALPVHALDFAAFGRMLEKRMPDARC
jgi:NifB/MoaA-like Fe-S oxidoreductase